MSDTHIYRQSWQPFTRYECYEMIFVHKPNDTRFHCHECLDRRAAKNLEIQAYYDTSHIRCKDGKHLGWT